MAQKKPKKKKIKPEDDIVFGALEEDQSDDLEIIPTLLPKIGIEKDEDWVDPEVEAAFQEEKEEEEVESTDEELHPAEAAAKYAAEYDEKHGLSVGGSDEQILKDLRKLVFNVPLMPQTQVHAMFLDMDAKLVPLVHKLCHETPFYLADIYHVVVKVGAGNTYGKNIYEREDSVAPDPNKPKLKTTYKDHEIEFLKQAHGLIRVYSSNSGSHEETTKSIESCQFIRGVYEELLTVFHENLSDYHVLHWNAAKAKLTNNLVEYNRLSERLKYLDQKYLLSSKVYGLSRDAVEVYSFYKQCRSQIISPYLRSVYSAARSTARNAHQMLDNFQNGSIGLIRAVSCYSTRRPASFASVAKWWIKQMMLLSIKEDANFVKLPVSTWQSYTQLEKARSKAGILEEDVDAIAAVSKMSAKKVKAVYQAVKLAQVYSLNRTYDADDKLSLEDIITNDDKIGSDTDGFSDLLREYCISANLDHEERLVLALKHGMPDILESTSLNSEHLALKEALVQNLARLGYDYKM